MASDRITQLMLKIAGILFPVFSMRSIPNKEPSAFSPDLISDGSKAGSKPATNNRQFIETWERITAADKFKLLPLIGLQRMDSQAHN